MTIIENVLNYTLKSNLLISKNNELNSIIPYYFINKIIQYKYIKGVYKEKTIITDGLNKPIIIQGTLVKEDLYNKFRVHEMSESFLIFYTKNKIRSFGIYDLELNKSNFEITQDIGSDIINNSIYTKGDSLISRNIENGNTNWSFDLTSLPKWQKYANEIVDTEVEQIIGEYDCKLWLVLNGYRLLVLDIQSGKKIHYISEDKLQIWGNLFLNKEKGLIQSLSGFVYTEYSLDKLVKTKRIEIDRKLIAQKTTNYKDDKYIYFCGYYDTVRNPNCYGIFDTEKCEVIWYKVSNDYYFFDPPQASDEYFAIFGSKPDHSAKDLFVYTREEIEEEMKSDKPKESIWYEYIFDKDKLIKSGVSNPEEFVRGKFKEMIQKEKDFFKSIENGGTNFNDSQLINLFGTNDISQIDNFINDLNSNFYKKIKVE